MSWLAKINLQALVERLGSFRSAILLLLLIVICLFCGYRMGNFFHGYQKQSLAEQQTRLTHLYEQNEEQLRRIHTLEVELEVERIANHESQKMLKAIEEQHYQVKTQLAFYEKVMAPEKQADGLVVDNFVITPTASENHFRFQVVLVQQKVQKRYAKGHIVVEFIGSQQQKPKKFNVLRVSELKKEDLNFNFQYFQVIEGEVTFPENFEPEKVDLAAVLPKSKWQTYQRVDKSYRWQDVVENVTQTSSLILD